jgi:hypothetical protein
MGEFGVGVQLLEQCFLVNRIEATFDVGIEHKFRFAMDAYLDHSDGIMG